MLLDELLVARQLTHGIVGQHANEQRGCGKALLSAAGVDLGLEVCVRLLMTSSLAV
jgi:hypothetical protein